MAEAGWRFAYAPVGGWALACISGCEAGTDGDVQVGSGDSSQSKVNMPGQALIMQSAYKIILLIEE